jgi:hypothetical protein
MKEHEDEYGSGKANRKNKTAQISKIFPKKIDTYFN